MRQHFDSIEDWPCDDGAWWKGLEGVVGQIMPVWLNHDVYWLVWNREASISLFRFRYDSDTIFDEISRHRYPCRVFIYLYRFEQRIWNYYLMASNEYHLHVKSLDTGTWSINRFDPCHKFVTKFSLKIKIDHKERKLGVTIYRKKSIMRRSIRYVRYKRVARIFSGGALFFLEKVDDLFLVVALKTQDKTTKLTTRSRTVQISPIS